MVYVEMCFVKVPFEISVSKQTKRGCDFTVQISPAQAGFCCVEILQRLLIFPAQNDTCFQYSVNQISRILHMEQIFSIR